MVGMPDRMPWLGRAKRRKWRAVVPGSRSGAMKDSSTSATPRSVPSSTAMGSSVRPGTLFAHHVTRSTPGRANSSGARCAA